MPKDQRARDHDRDVGRRVLAEFAEEVNSVPPVHFLATNSDAEERQRTLDQAVDLVLAQLSPEIKEFLRDFEGTEKELRERLEKQGGKDAPAWQVRIAAVRSILADRLVDLALFPRKLKHKVDICRHCLVECWKLLHVEQGR